MCVRLFIDKCSIGFNWPCIPVPYTSCTTHQTCHIAPFPWWRSSGMPGLPQKATVHQNVATAEEDIGLGPRLATSQSLRAKCRYQKTLITFAWFECLKGYLHKMGLDDSTKGFLGLQMNKIKTHCASLGLSSEMSFQLQRLGIASGYSGQAVP